MMRILLLGGTSFFGADIARFLLADGHQVALFTRGNSRPDFWDRVEHITGDRSDRRAFRDRLAGERFDAVIDNIAYNGADVQDLYDALGGRAGHYILTSTGSTYRYAPPTSPLVEESVDHDWTPPAYHPDDPGWQYAAGKLAAERVCIRGAIPWTIIRPPIVLGPHDHTLRGYYYFQRIQDAGPLLLRDSGNTSFRLAYSADLARAYVLALTSAHAKGGIFNVCQPEIITLTELCRHVAEVYGVGFEGVGVPQEVLTRVGLSGGPYYHMINFLPSVTAAQRDLGYTATPFKTWLTETALWFRDVYTGPASDGYATRARELDFATRWKQTLASL